VRRPTPRAANARVAQHHPAADRTNLCLAFGGDCVPFRFEFRLLNGPAARGTVCRTSHWEQVGLGLRFWYPWKVGGGLTGDALIAARCSPKLAVEHRSGLPAELTVF